MAGLRPAAEAARALRAKKERVIMTPCQTGTTFMNYKKEEYIRKLPAAISCRERFYRMPNINSWLVTRSKISVKHCNSLPIARG